MHWRCLEDLRGRGAVPAVWQDLSGRDFETLWFLRPAGRTAATYPCPDGCGCAHEVVRHADGGLVAVCACAGAGGCRDIVLGPDQAQVYELNVPMLGRAIVGALGCHSSFHETATPFIWQIGSYSDDAVPLLLSAPSEPGEFRSAVAQLGCRLRRQFLLFGPTNRFLNAQCQELLASHGAAFFDLQSHFQLTANDKLHSLRLPADLLAPFAPARVDTDEEAARRAFAMVRQLDTDCPVKSPSALTVFRLYCVEELNAAQIARKCCCSKSTIIGRLHLIRKATGVPPQQLRRFSAHFSAIEAAATDARAAHIHRQTLIDDAEEE